MRVVSFCSIFKGRRCEAGNLACSELRAQQADMIVCVTAAGRCLRGAPGGRALPSTEALAIQQAGIESIVDRLTDLDFFEIGMLGI